MPWSYPRLRSPNLGHTLMRRDGCRAEGTIKVCNLWLSLSGIGPHANISSVRTRIHTRARERAHVNHWHRNRRKWKRIIEFSGYWQSERHRTHRFDVIHVYEKCLGNTRFVSEGILSKFRFNKNLFCTLPSNFNRYSFPTVESKFRVTADERKSCQVGLATS